MEAKKAGKTRYIGFTGHKDPAGHLRMLEAAVAHGFHFDSCQMPLNLMNAHFRSFAQQVMPKLVDALNLPVSVVITGCESMEQLDQAMEAATGHPEVGAGASRAPASGALGKLLLIDAAV